MPRCSNASLTCYNVAWKCSTCIHLNLTYHKDQFVAVAGVAKQFADAYDDIHGKFVGGLSGNDVHTGLT
jgi:hypothetical protein